MAARVVASSDLILGFFFFFSLSGGREAHLCGLFRERNS